MQIKRTDIILKADYKRVLLRPFIIPENRITKVVKRISDLSDEDAFKELNLIVKDFEYRHKNLKEFYLKRFNEISKSIEETNFSNDKKLLIGAYFSMEYSIEAAAMFNPSIIWHPNQSINKNGGKKFIVSFRATGEGHISSIVFSSGEIDNEGNVKLDDTSKFVTQPNKIRDEENNSYVIDYTKDIDISEKIIFPHSPIESNGVEDARFVLFTEESGDKKYHATFTAYDGHSITPRILETTDFNKFKISSLKGSEVNNKGMALFPKKVNGKYAMLSRQDNENNYIMFSDDLYEWKSKQLILEPKFSWEFIQLGNCGSPIETKEGWLVLSHGVGAMRKYTISAFLLDLDNPSKVIGRLNEPLISPNETEREGYVPNVVYSCGGLIHNNNLIIPYAMSDYASSFASVNLTDVLTELTSSKNKNLGN